MGIILSQSTYDRLLNSTLPDPTTNRAAFDALPDDEMAQNVIEETSEKSKSLGVSMLVIAGVGLVAIVSTILIIKNVSNK